jgi:hypothetical protein
MAARRCGVDSLAGVVAMEPNAINTRSGNARHRHTDRKRVRT